MILIEIGVGLFLSLLVMETILVLLGDLFISSRDRSSLAPLLRFHPAILTDRISIIVPTKNESGTILSSIDSLLSLDYPEIEIIIVDDGSTDRTMDFIIEKYSMYAIGLPRIGPIPHKPVIEAYKSAVSDDLILLSKPPGGKSDALNAGIGVSSGALLVTIDSDTEIDPDALIHLSRAFSSPEIAVAGGRLVPKEAPGLITAFQGLEYTRAFTAGRAGWAVFGGLPCLSGAFSIFRRSDLIAAGGFLPFTVGEDMEVVLRLQMRAGKRAVFVPEAKARTEVPSLSSDLVGQRRRWQRGLLESLSLHIGGIGGLRVLSILVLPVLILSEILAPVIEASLILVLVVAAAAGLIGPWSLLRLLSVIYAAALLPTLTALLTEEESSMESILLALAEPILHRPIITFARLAGIIDHLLGMGGWGRHLVRGGVQRGRGGGSDPGLYAASEAAYPMA